MFSNHVIKVCKVSNKESNVGEECWKQKDRTNKKDKIKDVVVLLHVMSIILDGLFHA